MNTISIRYTPSNRVLDTLRTAFHAVCNAFRSALVASASGASSSDVWALYHLSRGADSVSPKVVRQLERQAGAN